MSSKPRQRAARRAPPSGSSGSPPSVPRKAESGKASGGHGESSTVREPSVLVDLPNPTPVTAQELDVLERYLGVALDALLSGKTGST